jgi:DNA-binding beta-propeller fold protein YncE
VRTLSFLTTTLVGIAVTVVAGCTSESESPISQTPSSGVAPAQVRSLTDLTRKASPLSVNPNKYKGLEDLYVTRFGADEVEILSNKTYKQVGTISSGLDTAQGDFLDTAGNLYVADNEAGDIQEYEAGGTSPSFTYNRSMVDPNGVSVDAHGNVYDADFTGSFVNEYPQKHNTVVHSCSPGGEVEGVAIDENNDVFVAYQLVPPQPGMIAEYKGGLGGCHETKLSVTLKYAGGMVLDQHDNIIVCDQEGPTVDVIDPPYSHVTKTLGVGFEDPYHVTLSKANELVFVADVEKEAVYVLEYPSGILVRKLRRPNFIPGGAVDGPNAVY